MNDTEMEGPEHAVGGVVPPHRGHPVKTNVFTFRPLKIDPGPEKEIPIGNPPFLGGELLVSICVSFLHAHRFFFLPLSVSFLGGGGVSALGTFIFGAYFFGVSKIGGSPKSRPPVSYYKIWRLSC